MGVKICRFPRCPKCIKLKLCKRHVMPSKIFQVTLPTTSLLGEIGRNSLIPCFSTFFLFTRVPNVRGLPKAGIWFEFRCGGVFWLTLDCWRIRS